MKLFNNFKKKTFLLIAFIVSENFLEYLKFFDNFCEKSLEKHLKSITNLFHVLDSFQV